MDWIQFILFLDDKNYLKLVKYNKEDIIKYQENEDDKILKEKNTVVLEDNKISEIFNWEYPYQRLSSIPSKTSVTKLKEIKNENNLKQINKKPKFLLNSLKLSNSEVGTLMHLIFQKLDFKKDYTEIDINNLLQDLKKKNIINENEINYININKILDFIHCDLYKKIQKSKKIYKEKPFYTCVKVQENLQDTILVQGIIDLCFENENGDFVLIDYKTDYAEYGKENELIEKYKTQLQIYKKALEESTGKKVSNTYIYSVHLSKTIEI